MKPIRKPAAAGPTLSGLVPAKGAPVFLKTEGYTLKSLSPEAIGQGFAAWLNDPALVEGLNLGRGAWTLAEARQFYGAGDNRRIHHIGIRTREGDQLIGFYTVKVSLQHRTAEFFAALGNHDYWGKGVIQETAKALVDYFFAKRDIEKITCRVLASNRRMFFNLARSRTFTLEAKLRSEARLPSGRRVDVYSFSVLKGETA